MRSRFRHDRRSFLRTIAAGMATAKLALRRTAPTSLFASASVENRLSPIRQVTAGVLDVGYYDAGPRGGPPVLLLHGFPYAAEGYAAAAGFLVEQGCRVVVPHLRGHGSTRFLDATTPRSGQQGALGVDVIELMNSLKLRRAVLAGYDWGGRAACVVAALWPHRCAGLVSANGYLIQDIARAAHPLPPVVEAALWYQFYFTTERGRAGLMTHRRDIARTLWLRNSPDWRFDEATLDRHAQAFENPDYVDVVVHSYRHRLGVADGLAAYTDVERRLAMLPAIAVPTITLDGANDGVVPATDGKASATRFTGPRSHRVIAGAGHNLPEEAPRDFADAVWEIASAAG